MLFSLFSHSDVTICSGLRLQHHSGFPQSHRAAFYKEKHISRHSLVWSYFCLADGAPLLQRAEFFFSFTPDRKQACYIKRARRLKGRNGECSPATDRRRLPSTLKSLFSSRKKRQEKRLKHHLIIITSLPPPHKHPRPSAGLESSHTTTFAANRSGDGSHLQSGCCCR